MRGHWCEHIWPLTDIGHHDNAAFLWFGHFWPLVNIIMITSSSGGDSLAPGLRSYHLPWSQTTVKSPARSLAIWWQSSGKDNRIRRRGVGPALVSCWSNVTDVGPAWSQCWANVVYFLILQRRSVDIIFSAITLTRVLRTSRILKQLCCP